MNNLELDKIYLGDCYKLISQIPDKSIDLVITDPPYEIVAGGQGGCFGDEHRTYRKEYSSLGVEEHKSMASAVRTQSTCVGFDYSLLNELDRVMKKTNIYIRCSKLQLLPLLEHYKDKLIEVLVWCKTNPTPLTFNSFLPDVEYCVLARDKGLGLGGGLWK